MTPDLILASHVVGCIVRTVCLSHTAFYAVIILQDYHHHHHHQPRSRQKRRNFSTSAFYSPRVRCCGYTASMCGRAGGRPNGRKEGRLHRYITSIVLGWLGRYVGQSLTYWEEDEKYVVVGTYLCNEKERSIYYKMTDSWTHSYDIPE